MSGILFNKNAVITGAHRGIGKATVERFAQYGANIWACARKNDADFEANLFELSERYKVWIKPIYFDMNNDGEMKAAIQEIKSAKISIDVLDR